MNAAVIAETVRRHVTSIGYVAFAVLVALLGIIASSFNTPASLWPSWISLLAIITGAALIGPEFSIGTLQLIVSKPMRRSTYVVSRIAGVFVSIAIAAMIGASAEIVTRMIRDALALRPVIVTLTCELLLTLLTIATLAFLGSVTRAYYNVAIYLGLQAGISMAEAFLGMLRIGESRVGALLQRYHVEEVLRAIDDAFFPGIPLHPDAGWALRIAATALVFIALACLAFQRREVPYGSE